MQVGEVIELIDTEVFIARQRREMRNAARINLLTALLEKATGARDIAPGGIRISWGDDELTVLPTGMLELVCTMSGDINSYNPEKAGEALIAPQSTELPEFFDAVLNAGPNEIGIRFILIPE